MTLPLRTKEPVKNQYFGDINDYRKYGLLRAVASVSDLRILVAWMLTLDDGGNDGEFTSYLEDSKRWAGHDPELFRGLQKFLRSRHRRSVGLMETSRLLPNCEFYSAHVPDFGDGRRVWFEALLRQTAGTDLVFLDPDNGLEVLSKPWGRSGSSKYLYWREVEALWASRKSLVIYQHFIRERRERFIQRLLAALGDAAPGSLVEAFSTPHVVFLLALQPLHRHLHGPIVERVQRDWAGQIRHWDLVGPG